MTMMTKMTALVGAAFAIFGATSASAAEIVSDGPWFGTFNIQYFSPVGQSFVAVDPILTSVGFYYTPAARFLPSAPITLTLFDGAGVGGNIVASRTFQPPVDATGYFDADFAGTALTVGSTYTAAVSSTTGYFGLGYTLNYYGDGQVYSALDLTDYLPVSPSSIDLRFRILGTDAVAAVPEPACWALMILGFGMVGAGLRRRSLVVRSSIAFG
jgi:hypothetical protein